MQQLGLQQAYITNPVLRGNIRKIAAISFVPVQDVVPAFVALSNQCGVREQPVLDYFETNYVGELRRGRRLPPLFPYELWNMHDRVRNGLPRTNNNLEEWHNSFSAHLNRPHPSIWSLIDVLKLDSSNSRIVLAQMLAGAATPPQKRVYRDVNQRTENLVQGYNLQNIIGYLRGISYNLATF